MRMTWPRVIFCNKFAIASALSSRIGLLTDLPAKDTKVGLINPNCLVALPFFNLLYNALLKQKTKHTQTYVYKDELGVNI